jgi:hypothetical protein
MRCSLFFPIVLLLACGRSHPEAASERRSDVIVSAAAENAGAALSPVVVQPVDRKIIRTGELRFEVTDLEASRAAILRHISDEGGYVEGDDRNDLGHALALTIRARIPADHFDAFLNSLQGLGELRDQHINANDVTAQWMDVEARVAAKRKVEARYLELVPAAKNVAEVLEVERELGNVRAEIESMEAQMKALRDQVSMSTLSITCFTPQAGNGGYTPHFSLALREGWDLFVQFLVGLLQLWPFLLLLVGIGIWVRRRRRTQRSRPA